MIIEATDLYTGKKNKWHVPSQEEALKNSVATWGKRYDKIEREVVEGGVPQLAHKVQ